MEISVQAMASSGTTSFGSRNSVSVGVHHPLCLHTSYAPRTPLISFQLTSVDNYAMWNIAMIVSLLGKNKLGFIDGTCTKELVDESLRAVWGHVYVVVLAWIMNAVSKDLLRGAVYSSNAHQVWINLQERFDQPYGTQVFHILKQIHTQNQGTMGISQYFSKLCFLMGLNESYS